MQETRPLEHKLILPYHYERSLKWYDRKVAKEVGRLILSHERIGFWHRVFNMRQRDEELYSEKVIFERMYKGWKETLNTAYRKIHKALEIPPEYHRFNYYFTEGVDWLCEDRFDPLDTHLGFVSDAIARGEFNVREGLRFLMHPNFLIGRGPEEQQFMTEQAIKRYKEACENLV